MIFEERSEPLTPPSLRTTGDTLTEAAHFEDSASTASTLSPVPDNPEFDKDSDIQTMLQGHDNQANATMHAGGHALWSYTTCQLPPRRTLYPMIRACYHSPWSDLWIRHHYLDTEPVPDFEIQTVAKTARDQANPTMHSCWSCMIFGFSTNRLYAKSFTRF